MAAPDHGAWRRSAAKARTISPSPSAATSIRTSAAPPASRSWPGFAGRSHPGAARNGADLIISNADGARDEPGSGGGRASGSSRSGASAAAPSSRRPRSRTRARSFELRYEVILDRDDGAPGLARAATTRTLAGHGLFRSAFLHRRDARCRRDGRSGPRTSCFGASTCETRRPPRVGASTTQEGTRWETASARRTSWSSARSA